MPRGFRAGSPRVPARRARIDNPLVTGAGVGRESDGLKRTAVEGLVRLAFPRARVVDAGRLVDVAGRISLRLTVSGAPSPLLLRAYPSDPAACVGEVAVLRALPGVVPVPVVHHSAPHDDPPWSLFSWLHDGPMPAALRRYSPAAALMLANDLGALLSAVHRVPPLDSCPALPRWTEGMGALLSNGAVEGLGPRLVRSLRDFTLAYGARIDALFDEVSLCHGSLTPSKVIVYASSGVDDRTKLAGWVQWDGRSTFDRPRLDGIVDWASAVNGPSLLDVGSLLRMEHALPAGFADEFAAGYARWDTPLPPDWRWLARCLDLVRLCGLAEHCGEPRLKRIRRLISSTLDTNGRQDR